MRHLLGTQPFSLAIMLVLASLYPASAAAYDPVTCVQSPCEILAGDRVALVLQSELDVAHWIFDPDFTAIEGLTLSPVSGELRWTPTQEQTGEFVLPIRGNGADGTSLVNTSVSVTVAPNPAIDWSRIIFVSPSEYAPSKPNDMTGAASTPYDFWKFGSRFCKDSAGDPITTATTVYFRGGVHTTSAGVNPADIFCNGVSLDQPFTLTAWGNERPILAPKGAHAIKIRGDFVVLDGFEIRGYAAEISLEEALELWWNEDNPTTEAGHNIIAQGILAKGHGAHIRNNIVHSWPGNAIKIEGDLSTLENNIVFNSGYWSTRGVGGVMVEGMNNSSYAMPADREFGIVVKDNLVFANESRIISHVFGKGFTTLEIDEGSALNLQQNNGDFSRRYLVENNFFLYNGKGVGLRSKDVTFRRNTVVGNGLNIRAPGASGVRVTKITTSGLAAVWNGDDGATAAIHNNLISVPDNQEAISVDAVSRVDGGCSNNIFRGLIDDKSASCLEANNLLFASDPVTDRLTNDYSPVTGELGASPALVQQAQATLTSYGYRLQPSGFDIMSIEAYDSYVLPMINTILASVPQDESQSDAALSFTDAADAPTVVDLSDDDFSDLLAVSRVDFNWSGTRPTYNGSDRFTNSYYQVIKPHPTARNTVTATVEPALSGYVVCNANSFKVTGNNRLLTCAAVPLEGYEFVTWEGDCAGQLCQIDDVDANVALLARFEPLDTLAPTIAVPADIQVAAVDQNGTPASRADLAQFLASASASDNVDGALTPSNNAPNVFPLGSTAVVFSATDSAGNTGSASAMVTVTDQTPPLITLTGNASVLLAQGDPFADPGATAADNVDGDLSLDIAASGAVNTSIPGHYTITYSVADAAGNTSSVSRAVVVEAVDSDGDGVVDSEDAFPNLATETQDSDADGIGDNFENQYGLDPLNPDDAALDADQDGIANVDEFLAGTNALLDEAPPVFSEALAAIVVPASGFYTAVPLPNAVAHDLKDGAITATPSELGPFRVGEHVIIWTAEDEAGNTAMGTQIVHVTPTVSVPFAYRVNEADSLAIEVTLSGEPDSYPVTIPLHYDGSAVRGEDYIAPDEIIIDAGLSAELSIATLADSTGETVEDIIVSLGEPAGLVSLSAHNKTLVQIFDEPSPPAVRIAIVQNATATHNLSSDAGVVTLTAVVDDINGNHSYDWSLNDNRVALQGDLFSDTVQFDPSQLIDGYYTARVAVSDDAFNGEVFEQRALFHVSTGEIIADSDNDGIPNHADVIDSGNEIALAIDDPWVVATANKGVKLKTGDISRQTRKALRIEESDIQTLYSLADSAYAYPNGLLDFTADLPVPGSVMDIVIPLAFAIPADAQYRKFKDFQFQDFILDDLNNIASAASSASGCPAASSEAYSDGLHAGDRCVRISIQDGGPNDDDGQINGTIVDPGGIAVQVPDLSSALLDWVRQNFAQGGGESTVMRFLIESNGADTQMNAITFNIEGDIASGDVSALALYFDSNGDGIAAVDELIGKHSFATTVTITPPSPIALSAGANEFIVTMEF